MSRRFVLVTIDTEVDKDATWAIASPASFDSVLRGIPDRLTPLFEAHGVRPTYLISPEVLGDAACIRSLERVRDSGELGAHLHGDFLPPLPTLTPANMAGGRADAIQTGYSSAVERAKLGALTERFTRAFGYAPTSFRAGRFAARRETFEILAELGYRVDSSITPGILWRYREGTVDHRDWTGRPRRVPTPAGAILEIPVSVLPRWPLHRLPKMVQRHYHLVPGGAAHSWLRPSWCTGRELIRYVARSREHFLVLMFHSTEVSVGRSPYSRTEGDVHGILRGLDELFDHCRREGMTFVTLTEAAEFAEAA